MLTNVHVQTTPFVPERMDSPFTSKRGTERSTLPTFTLNKKGKSLTLSVGVETAIGRGSDALLSLHLHIVLFALLLLHIFMLSHLKGSDAALLLHIFTFFCLRTCSEVLSKWQEEIPKRQRLYIASQPPMLLECHPVETL